jgi:Peroxisomal biogenesis factor 11 (PEX11)
LSSKNLSKLIDNRSKKVLSVTRAKSIEDNISNGRKIFRFMLFLNEYSEMNDILKNQKHPIGLKILKFLSAICSHNYYLFDNIVWFT